MTNLSEARACVIESGVKLLRAGLIARTWGNVSSRLSDSHFVITPSGRSYEDLEPQEIVIANIRDENYWGSVLPSSEIGVHREIYRRRPLCQFIIHTHQFEASVFSALDRELEAADVPVFGGRVPCALYGLPGSETLRRRVAASVDATLGNAVLMAHHGAVLMAESDDDGFRLALALEIVAARRISEEFLLVTGTEPESRDSLYEYYLGEAGLALEPVRHSLYPAVRDGDGFILHAPDGPQRYALEREQDDFAPETLRRIFVARPDVQHIVQGSGGGSRAFARLGDVMPTYLDDTAQIGGVDLRCAPCDPAAVCTALGSNHGVFVRDCGVLCCGGSADDATACALVIEKNARAHFVSLLFNSRHALSERDALYLRDFYLNQYSRRFRRR